MKHFELANDDTLMLSGRLEHQTLDKDLWLVMSNAQRQSLVQKGKLTISLAKVDYVDSAGLAWLINAIRHARGAKVEIALSDVPDKLLKLAKISDVDRLLPLQ